MKLLKHMEAVFVITLGLAVSGSHLFDLMPKAHARAVASEDAHSAPATVIVSAKRMGPREKAMPLQGEPKAFTPRT